MSTWNVVFGLRNGDEIPTLSCYWGGALKINLRKCTEYANKIHSKQSNQPRDESYLYAMRTYFAPVLFNSKVNELKGHVCRLSKNH